MDDRPPLLEPRPVGEQRGGVPALVGVDRTLRAGGLDALVGDDAEADFTLVTVISGVSQPDPGQILLDGTEVNPASAQTAELLRDARNNGSFDAGIVSDEKVLSAITGATRRWVSR